MFAIILRVLTQTGNQRYNTHVVTEKIKTNTTVNVPLNNVIRTLGTRLFFMIYVLFTSYVLYVLLVLNPVI